MKRFIQLLLISLAMLVGFSVSFAHAPDKKKVYKDRGYNTLELNFNDVTFHHVTLGLPPDCWQGIDIKTIHNTPYLLNKHYLNNRPLGQSDNSKQFLFTRGFDL